MYSLIVSNGLGDNDLASHHVLVQAMFSWVSISSLLGQNLS